MYRYDEFDHALVQERVEEFRGQVARRLSGELSEEEFRPLRLMNGLYLQLHAYMLRVAIPYGTVSSKQMRMFAHIARKYDKGYGHFTTRQNIQYNWPELKDVPDLLADLARVEMHAIQTSGNCIRNTTSDQYAGVATDEIEDPRPYCEIIRQWSTFHPEFSYLPRKFKIAVTGAAHDRAAIQLHDIGLVIKKDDAGETGFEVWVGGGQGRTPVIAKKVRDYVSKDDLLGYLEAVMRVYNQLGRRDNMYKARIKILVNETGQEEFTRLVEEEFDEILKTGVMELPADELARIATYFAEPEYEALSNDPSEMTDQQVKTPAFARWLATNVDDHKVPGYAIVNISLKPIGGIPGDASDVQMDAIADVMEAYSLDEIRVTHEQNLTLPYVRQKDLYEIWQKLKLQDLATPNIGLVSDMIACPGLDYCNLANARSIPIAQEISERFADLDRQHNVGELKVKISGCINACGHHHVGHIGILGVDRKGVEYYQITLGGSADENAAIGDIVGPSFDENEIVGAIETIVDTYVDLRSEGETFLTAYRRVGLTPFKEKLYGTH